MSIIEIKNVSKWYQKNQVIKNINLEFEGNSIIGYIGQNGAGKSTTIKMLAGLITDFEGEINILGMDIKKNIIEVKKHIGYIPEQAILYECLTPVEYLEFIGGLHEIESAKLNTKILELLKIFDLYEKADERMTSFSKGMKQKVLLIAGFIHNPEIILLDEPLSGLDANAVILVKEILVQLKLAGKTIFYSSHIMDVVEKMSDKIVIIDKGEIIANDTIDNLKSNLQNSTLESIFKNLTGNDQTYENADNFVNILKS